MHIFFQSKDGIAKLEELEIKYGYVMCLRDMRKLGWEIHIPDDADEDWGDDSCSCGIDVEAILERNNIIYYNDAVDYNVFSTEEEKQKFIEEEKKAWPSLGT